MYVRVYLYVYILQCIHCVYVGVYIHMHVCFLCMMCNIYIHHEILIYMHVDMCGNNV